VQIRLETSQLEQAFAECDDIYVWVDDLFGEMGAYVRVDKEHFLGTLKAETKKGWRLYYDVILKGADLWIGGGG